MNLTPKASPRPYRSPQRAEQAWRTRGRILSAASELFCSSGYSGTTMGAIAAAAGVSVPTVELIFRTKAELLKEAIDIAIAGDQEPIPVLQRPWAAEAAAAASATEFVRLVSVVLVEAAQRADALVLVAFEAARSDPRLAPLAEQLKAQRAVVAAWIVDGVRERAGLRPGLRRSQAIDVVWLLMDPAVFQGLTDDRGWSAARFRTWFADSVMQLVAGP